MRFKKIILMMLLILSVLTISSVSAIDTNDNGAINLEDTQNIQTSIEQTDDNIIAQENADNINLEQENDNQNEGDSLKESNSDMKLETSADDEIYSTTETSLTSRQKSYTCYYGESFELKYRFTQHSDEDNVKKSKIEIRIYTGNSYKSVYSTISKTGMDQSFILEDSMDVNCKNIKVGKHKLEAYIDGQYAFTKNLVIKKSSVGYYDDTVKKFEYKKNTYYELELWNKKTYEPIKNAYFKVKIYTGSKYKTYKIKTKMFESNSWLKIPTKNLKVGTHKIIVTPYDKYYTGTFKSKISIYSAKKTTTSTTTSNTKTVTKGKYKATFSKAVWNEAKRSPGMWDKQIKNTGVKTHNGNTVKAYIYTYGNDIGVSWSAGGYKLADKYLGQTTVRC